ncbi:MBL fold metallo-hydrolase RNA specificity domain-containing protein [Corallococcus carmarthensis]|uniref:MBL fold metallo-hydrolase RNA specificity domain-containing protein n=1 Tax=Corallococcus carmarthensis TaxID=2316728 RepID=UPI00148D4192|nr:MBL fold metallo-hydrolase [Corallococcus carmarthensis]NOK18402.1 MBL fold metallo-hydrolase [Corallococcus carmarthensis]
MYLTDDEGAPTVTLRFLGAAGTVTGSKFLLETEGREQRRVLLDCGLFQGLKGLRLRNWEPPPFDPVTLDAVVLSHAHLDHSGALPLLVRGGFAGPIHCTPGTADLLEPLLLDSAHLQEEDAERANRHGYSRHQPALPLYTVEDARRVLALLRTHPYGTPFAPCEGLEVTFRRAGHILGSATVDVAWGRGDAARHLVYSGDLGRPGRPILRDPEAVPGADVLLLESTYGDRVHATWPEEKLARVITRTAHQGGAVVIPVFAVGRAQELLWTLHRLRGEQRLPHVPVFLDSPMAQDVTELYCRHPEDHDVDMRRLTEQARCPLCGSEHHWVRTAEESQALLARTGPRVILAGSGMATGGRVLHHLKHLLPDARNTVVLAGYQAAGTRGRALQDGAATVRIHGEDVPVRARVETVDGLSAHADREELLGWLRTFPRPPRETWLVHGEPGAAEALARSIRERMGWRVRVARDGERVTLR